jgi:hypothetical protein
VTLGRKLYAGFAALLLGGYGWSEAVGWEASQPARETIAPAVRQSPGGWRSYTFWHQGLHGGK